MRRVIVIGGGASGLMAAITAARNGAKVTIIEQKDCVGKKILSTGNGRCNLTNAYMDSSCFRGDDSGIVAAVLEQFGYRDTITFFESLGVILKDRQGYIYPFTDQASTIVDVLKMEVRAQNVCVMTEEMVMDITREKQQFVVTTSTHTHLADAVILATGGKAAPVLGSDGKGYILAQQFGHHISPVVPALVQLKGNGSYFKNIAGIRTQANVSLFVNQQLVGSDCGELQITNYGISGIPVFQISRYAAKAFSKSESVFAEIDFMPQIDESKFQDFIWDRVKQQKNKTAEEFIIGLLHKKLGVFLLKEAQIPPKICIKDIYEEKIERFIQLCKHFRIDIEGTNDFEQAQVCAGGVKTTEISYQTMESIYEKDLYIVGELLDVDGICGGYNLQWAWSTGFIAGKYAAKG